jgi:hypothetical protein
MSKKSKQPIAQIPIAEDTLLALAGDCTRVYFPNDNELQALNELVARGWLTRVNHGGYGYAITVAGSLAVRKGIGF